ncbi:DUF6886 family protein [Streptomyces ginkgonis]|uniref:DUF6886 family protein n=1 Tax=Streptomyces ginkgonis TaxID=1812259 RepID=UPI0034D6CF62
MWPSYWTRPCTTSSTAGWACATTTPSPSPPEPIRPLGPAEPVGDLLELHRAAGIQLRVLDNLWPYWAAVTGSSPGFSGIRLRNAKPAPADPGPAG